MTDTSRRAALAGGASAIVGAIAGCLGDGTDEWETDTTLSVTAATLYQGESCDCCGVYAEYLQDHLDGDLEVAVTDDLAAVKEERGVDSSLQSCHTVDLEGYVIEGHVPVEVVATLLEDEPDVDGIALPGMPAGSPGMGGEKDETWTIYELDATGEPGVYAEL